MPALPAARWAYLWLGHADKPGSATTRLARLTSARPPPRLQQPNDTVLKSLWTDWKKKWKNGNVYFYGSKDGQRFAQFKSNVGVIFRGMATCRDVWPLLGARADWTLAEKAANRQLWLPPYKDEEAIQPKYTPQVPTFDWRALDKVSPARDQGKVGRWAAREGR